MCAPPRHEPSPNHAVESGRLPTCCRGRVSPAQMETRSRGLRFSRKAPSKSDHRPGAVAMGVAASTARSISAMQRAARGARATVRTNPPRVDPESARRVCRAMCPGHSAEASVSASRQRAAAAAATCTLATESSLGQARLGIRMPGWGVGPSSRSSSASSSSSSAPLRPREASAEAGVAGASLCSPRPSEPVPASVEPVPRAILPLASATARRRFVSLRTSRRRSSWRPRSAGTGGTHDAAQATAATCVKSARRHKSASPARASARRRYHHRPGTRHREITRRLQLLLLHLQCLRRRRLRLEARRHPSSRRQGPRRDLAR